MAAYAGLRRTWSKSPKTLFLTSWHVFRHVDDIDLYAGAMAEKHLKDSFLGPTFTCIMAEQFRNLKLGDRFWYETSDNKIGFTMGMICAIGS